MQGVEGAVDVIQAATRPNVLVVDDTLENLRLLTQILSDVGYEVRPMVDARLALRAAELDPPDLVLLDICMPEMNGRDMCAAMKANPRLEAVPVIFLTALTEVSEKVRAFDVGGVDYITKPFQVEEVQARVKTHLALQRTTRELGQSYARLQELEKLRDDLVHMIVHDMRSPLAVLMANLQLLEEAAAVNEDDRHCIAEGLVSVRTLTRMTNDVLDVRRLEEGKLPLDLTVCDLTDLVARTRTLLAPLDPSRQVHVHSEGRSTVRCDGGLIGRVLENLLGNAIKHTPIGSGIDVVVAGAGDRVRVLVSDQGPGVPAGATQRIFEKFGAPAGKGVTHHSAGLGLAFCKLAVEAHGGTIGVESLEPNGSRFWFELPSEC
jgi:signal transduction histidine kinase